MWIRHPPASLFNREAISFSVVGSPTSMVIIHHESNSVSTRPRFTASVGNGLQGWAILPQTTVATVVPNHVRSTRDWHRGGNPKLETVWVAQRNPRGDHSPLDLWSTANCLTCAFSNTDDFLLRQYLFFTNLKNAGREFNGILGTRTHTSYSGNPNEQLHWLIFSP